MSFHGLIADFFLVLNNIALSGWNTIYLSSHLLVDILQTQVLAIMNKVTTNIHVRVFMWTYFTTPLDKNQGV